MEKDKVTRRNFLGATSAAMLGTMLPQQAGAYASKPEQSSMLERERSIPPKRMNLILFMPDELRADALACYGNPLTKTPNFDRLAKEGTRFANCHVQYPICGASRCSLLTGWPTSVRGHRSQSYFLRPEEPNMFRYLRQAGYDVFWFGHHNDALAPQTFSDSVTYWTNSTDGAGRQASKLTMKRKTVLPGGNATTFLGQDKGSGIDSAEHRNVKEAIAILERRQSERPFCIYLPMISPHPPYAPYMEYDTYKPSDIEGLRPPNLPHEPAFRKAIRKAYGLDRVSKDVFQTVRAKYYGCVSYSDWLLGELLQAVERTNHTKDTAVFMTSDHGDYAGDYGLVEKWPSDLADPLTHVPLIGRIPGGITGNVVDQPVMLYDIMNTFLELADTRAQHTHFSRSLLPQLTKGVPGTRTAAFAEGGYNSYEPQCFEDTSPIGSLYYPRLHLQSSDPRTVSRTAMIRTSKHKLIHRPQGGSELYSYEDDPQELKNRFSDRSLEAVRIELQQRLLEWYIDTTGIAPFDKDQRNTPPFYPTPNVPPDDNFVGG